MPKNKSIVSMPRFSKPVVYSIAGLAALALAVYFFQARNSADTAASPWAGRAPTPVVVAPVVMDEFVDSIEAIGTALANESIIVKPKITETVVRVNFEDDQVVEKGDVLIELMDTEAQADLDEARSTLREAEKQYQRTANLVKRGSATQSSLDTALSTQERAQARVTALEARLENHKIVAPFAGVLGLRMVSPGTLVGPADEITTLDDISVIKLDFSVPETFLSALKKGLDVTARAAAYPDHEFKGQITAIDTRVDPVTRSVKVRARLANPDGLLKPGMLLTTTVLKNRRQSIKIPETALVPVLEDVFVFVVKPGKRGTSVERKAITIGARRISDVEVLSGLNVGERVVTEGTNRVRPGSVVRIVGDKEKGAPETAKRKPWQS